MAKFSYTATKNGKPVSGTIEAADRHAALDALGRQGVTPLVVKGIASPRSFGKGGSIKLKDIVIFTRQLSTMISAGVPLTRALATLQTQASNKSFQVIIATVSKDIEGGMNLADALRKHPKAFSDVYVNMVQAGEAGGILDEILKRLASQVEKDAAIRKKIKSAMAYPVAVMGITVVAFFGIMLFVIPKLGKIIKDLGGEGAKLPALTQNMLNMSDFMRNNIVVIVIILAVTKSPGASLFFISSFAGEKSLPNTS